MLYKLSWFKEVFGEEQEAYIEAADIADVYDKAVGCFPLENGYALVPLEKQDA